jgi:hypothetical protein
MMRFMISFQIKQTVEWLTGRYGVSKSSVSRHQAAGIADARQGERTTTRTIWKCNEMPEW